ncbi:MAG: hypothetical protein ACI920_000216 [Saprospiraceae bacterium]|jgi:hypothetical protein
MAKIDLVGMSIASNEFEEFLNDAKKYHISNIYLNKIDVEANEKDYTGPIKRFKTLKSRIAEIGKGVSKNDLISWTIMRRNFLEGKRTSIMAQVIESFLLIVEFNNNIFYKLSIGFGICDYHLKLSESSSFPITEKYLNIRETENNVLKRLINKNPRHVIPTTCHNVKTVLKGLEFRNHDKTRFSIIGHHFKFEDELGTYQFYDSTWILVDELAIETMKYI